MDRFFGVTAAGSRSVGIIGSTSTFLTMSFIVAVNLIFPEAAGIPLLQALSPR